jgi:flagella basal body P-ring formation protein FlgA
MDNRMSQVCSSRFHSRLRLVLWGAGLLLLSTTVRAAEMGAEVIQELAEACIDSMAGSAGFTDRETGCISVPRARQVPCGQLHARGPATLQRPGIYMVRLLDCDGATVASVAVRLRAFAEVLCVTTEIPRGASISATNTAVRRAPLDAQALTHLASDQPIRARRRLAADTPLRRSDVEPVPAILAGEHVTAYLQRGGLRIALSGRALEDGIRGELFTLHDPATRRALRARALGPGRARLEP